MLAPAGPCCVGPTRKQVPSCGRPLRPCTAGTVDLLLARRSLAECDPTLLAGAVAWRGRWGGGPPPSPPPGPAGTCNLIRISRWIPPRNTCNLILIPPSVQRARGAASTVTACAAASSNSSPCSARILAMPCCHRTWISGYGGTCMQENTFHSKRTHSIVREHILCETKRASDIKLQAPSPDAESALKHT